MTMAVRGRTPGTIPGNRANTKIWSGMKYSDIRSTAVADTARKGAHAKARTDIQVHNLRSTRSGASLLRSHRNSSAGNAFIATRIGPPVEASEYSDTT